VGGRLVGCKSRLALVELDHAALAAPSHLALRRGLLPADRVRELSRLRPARVARDIAIAWATIVAAWLVAARLDRPAVTVAAALVVGNRFYALFIIGHDGLHRRLHPRQAVSDLLADLFVMAPIGTITRINNRNHLLHHQHLATEADPDRFKHGSFNKRTRLQVLGYLSSLTSVGTTLAHVANRGAPPVAGELPRADRRRTPRDLALLAGTQLGLLVGLTSLFGWWGYLAMWWAPVFVCTFLADNLRTFAEHAQCSTDAEADHRRLVTTRPRWLERQLLAPMHMNLHAAHHLWPSIPYYNLPQADAELRSRGGSPALDERRSYLGFVWRFVRELPRDGGEPAVAVTRSA
jgi:fatty acid desaturase